MSELSSFKLSKPSKFCLAFLLSISAVVFSSAALAQESANESFLPGTFSGTAGITTDYVFRGISQSEENPAVQAGFLYKQNFDPAVGAYLGIWGSNVDFQGTNDANVELDYSGGLTYQLGKLALDGGFIYYSYPASDGSFNNDYWEAQITAGYDFGAAYFQGSFYYSPDYFGGSGDSYYTKVAGEVPLPNQFKLIGSLGYMSIEENATYGAPDYTTWSLGGKYALAGFDLTAEYIDTDITNNECRDICGSRGVLSISRSF